MKNKAIFLDRDGVLNVDFVNYAYNVSNFFVIESVPEAVRKLKNAGYLLIIVTNQSGIAKGLYTEEDVWWCHRTLEKACNLSFDGFYYAVYHPITSASLTRKPDSLMFEKAIARFNIDLENSWMIGDKERDMEPAHKVGIRNLIKIGKPDSNSLAQNFSSSLLKAANQIILNT